MQSAEIVYLIVDYSRVGLSEVSLEWPEAFFAIKLVESDLSINYDAVNSRYRF